MSLQLILNRFTNNFPTTEDSKRLEYIRLREFLFKGENSKVFLDDLLIRLCAAGVSYKEFIPNSVNHLYRSHSPNSAVGRSRVEAMLRSYNLLKPICSVKNRFLFGDKIICKDADDNRNMWLNGTEDRPDDGFVDRINLYTELSKSALGGQYRGDSIIKLWRNEDKQAQLSIISAKYWFPVAYIEDNKKVLANCIVEEYKDKRNMNKSQNGTKCEDDIIYKITASEKGVTYYFAVEKKDEKLTIIEYDEVLLGMLPAGKSKAEMENVWKEDTQLDYPVIFRVPTIPCDDSIYGTTDFDDACISQFREIFIRMTQNSRIIDRNTDPLMVGPAGFRSEDENGQEVVETSGKYMAVDKEDADLKYVEFGGEMLTKSKEIIKEAIESIYGMTNVNASALGSTQEGLSALSGTAIEKVYATPIAEGNRQWQLWNPIIKDIIKCARQLEVGVNDAMPEIGRESGLPKTDMEKIEVMLAKNGNQPVISQLESIRQSNAGISNDDALKLQAMILQEQKDREGIEPIDDNNIEFGE